MQMGIRVKKNKIGNTTILLKTSIALVCLMILITIAGFSVFKISMDRMTVHNDGQLNEFYDRHYVLITDNPDTTFWQSVYNGARTYGQENGSYVELMGSNLSEDYDAVELMKIAIASKVDGIIVQADESTAMRRQINLAIENEIPVVTAFNDNQDSKRTSYVGVSDYNIGQEYGNQICNYAEKIFSKQYGIASEEETKKNEISVLVLMNSDKTDTGENIIFSGIKEAIASNEKYCSKIRIETAAINAKGTFSAEESIRDIFMNYNDLPDIMVCLDELNTTCVYQAVVDYNKVGQIYIIGFYQSDTILKAIKRKVLQSTISIDTNQMGEYCVTALDEYIRTKRVSDYFSVDTFVIVPDNVNQYIGEENNAE